MIKRKKGKQLCLTTVRLHKVEGKLCKASVFVNAELVLLWNMYFYLRQLKKCISLISFSFFSLFFTHFRWPMGTRIWDLGSRKTHSQLNHTHTTEFSTLRQDFEHKNSPASEDVHERATPRTRDWSYKDGRVWFSPLIFPNLKDRTVYNHLPLSEVTSRI